MANILVVDDDPVLVDLMATIVTKAGHRVVTAYSGMEALRKLGLEPEDPEAALLDLVILDIMMPRSDGYTVGTVIRTRERTRDIPILVVSVLERTSPLFNAAVHVEGFLNKPFSPDELLANIAKILANAKTVKPETTGTVSRANRNRN